MDLVYTFKRVEMSYLITVEKSFPIKQNVLPQIQLFSLSFLIFMQSISTYINISSWIILNQLPG